MAAALFVFGSPYHTVIPASWVAQPPFTVAALHRSAGAEPFRLLQWDSLKLHSNVAVHRATSGKFRPTAAAGPGHSAAKVSDATQDMVVRTMRTPL